MEKEQKENIQNENLAKEENNQSDKHQDQTDDHNKKEEEDKKEIRLWEITFLDEELRIMRAKNIKDRNATPFIFVLERKQPNRLISNLAGFAR